MKPNNQKTSSDAAGLHPVRQSRIYSEIVDQILGLIKSGNIGVGDRLPSERHLAQQLDVSRSALREAITALEVLGVVEVRPGVGIFIGPRQADQDAVAEQVSTLIEEAGPNEILEVRAIVEPGFARVAAGRRTDADLVALETMVKQMESDLREGRDGWEPDLGFHKAVAAATRNPFAELVLNTLAERMQKRLWKLARAHNFEALHRGMRYAQDHRAIFEAVRLGDGDAAFRLMHAHIRTIQADLEADQTLTQVNNAEAG